MDSLRPTPLEANADSRITEAQATAPVIFARQAALDRIDGDEDFLAVLIGMVLDEIPGDIALLGLALDAGRAAVAGDYAHGIKGAASAVGAMALVQLAATLEQAARAGRLVESRPTLALMSTALADFARAVQIGS